MVNYQEIIIWIIFAFFLGINIVVTILFLTEYSSKGDSKYKISILIVPYLIFTFTYVLTKCILFIYDIFSTFKYQGNQLSLSFNFTIVWLITFAVDFLIVFMSIFLLVFY